MRISDCPISLIDDHAFAGLVELEKLHIVACGLTSMPAVSDVKGTLIELSLNTNHISFVPHGYFRGFRKLSYLLLVGNLLTEIPDVTDLASTLYSLSVSKNNITHFPNWMLNISMMELGVLSISDNRIREFPPMILHCQSQLKSVNLRWNELTTVSQYSGVTRNITTTVMILGNPLHCDSSLAWLAGASQIGTDDITTGGVEYSSGHCESPQWLKDRSLDEMGLY